MNWSMNSQCLYFVWWWRWFSSWSVEYHPMLFYSSFCHKNNWIMSSDSLLYYLWIFYVSLYHLRSCYNNRMIYAFYFSFLWIWNDNNSHHHWCCHQHCPTQDVSFCDSYPFSWISFSSLPFHNCNHHRCQNRHPNRHHNNHHWLVSLVSRLLPGQDVGLGLVE